MDSNTESTSALKAGCVALSSEQDNEQKAGAASCKETQTQDVQVPDLTGEAYKALKTSDK
jgi:hypothetical protein